MPRPTEQTRCMNCQWWEEILPPNADKGECRRGVPHILTDGDKEPKWVWPTVTKHKWCFGFKKAK